MHYYIIYAVHTECWKQNCNPCKSTTRLLRVGEMNLIVIWMKCRTYSPVKLGAKAETNSPKTNRMDCSLLLRWDHLTAASQLQPSSLSRGIAPWQNKRCNEDNSIPFAFPGSVSWQMLKGCLQEGKTISAVQGTLIKKMLLCRLDRVYRVKSVSNSTKSCFWTRGLRINVPCLLTSHQK